ncbi:MAG: 2-dehydropantoate 2-reductase [Chloroflexi bacterium]|nr:2-dehydropantoate 2-reductase [Chloroflexota bacterium]
MRIAVFGTGGASGYFGAMLARRGQEVVFIARGAHLQAMRANGLHLETPTEQFVLNPIEATDDPAQAGSVDAVILGVKTWDVLAAAESMRGMMRQETCVAPLQNGVEAPFQIASVLGTAHAVGGMARIVSFITAPGHIKHAGFEPLIAFGELDNRPSARLERLRDAFRDAGVPCEIPRDIHVALWNKFLFVVAFGGVGALTRVPAGVLRSDREMRALLEQAMGEIFDVARARGIALPDDAVANGMRLVDSLPSDATSSLQRDIMEGKRSELDAWSGAVVRLGREVNVTTPTHQFIYDALLPFELLARGESAKEGTA